LELARQVLLFKYFSFLKRENVELSRNVDPFYCLKSEFWVITGFTEVLLNGYARQAYALNQLTGIRCGVIHLYLKPVSQAIAHLTDVVGETRMAQH